MTETTAARGGGLAPFLLGFGLVGATLGGADGWLIGDSIVGGLTGALFGGLIGVGLVLLAWRPRAIDQRVEHVAEHAQPPYFLIWGVLFVLTMVEVGVAFLALSKTLIIVSLILLAIWKAVLVALYYMHLRFEPHRLRILTLAPIPLAMFLVLAVLTEF